MILVCEFLREMIMKKYGFKIKSQNSAKKVCCAGNPSPPPWPYWVTDLKAKCIPALRTLLENVDSLGYRSYCTSVAYKYNVLDWARGAGDFVRLPPIVSTFLNSLYLQLSTKLLVVRQLRWVLCYVPFKRQPTHIGISGGEILQGWNLYYIPASLDLNR